MERAKRRAGKLAQFNPNGVGMKNGRFIGLPFEEEDAEVVIISVPWDVTVSFGAGTADGPRNVLTESGQLDLEDPPFPDAWKRGIYVRPPVAGLRDTSQHWRGLAERYIEHLEIGGDPDIFTEDLEAINQACAALHEQLYDNACAVFKSGQTPGLLGGDHSTPYGLIRASVERYPDLGILQIDAHMDLRQAYEGFTWSHASIFRNVMDRLPVKKLVQAGIRDFCREELDYTNAAGGRITVFLDSEIRRRQFEGTPFSKLVDEMIGHLPNEVHISFDIDGLDPALCPGTGTPVPGGFSFSEAMYILERVKTSGRQVVSFDLCEVGGQDAWDGNTGARVLYRLANVAGR
jgi:agmatinase